MFHFLPPRYARKNEFDSPSFPHEQYTGGYAERYLALFPDDVRIDSRDVRGLDVGEPRGFESRPRPRHLEKERAHAHVSMRQGSHAATTIVLVGFIVAAMASMVLTPGAATRYRWSVETVDDVGNAGQHSSLTIVSNGTIYVLYHDDDGTILRLATRFAGTWQFEDVAGPGLFAGDTSLALDFAGDLHASYYDAELGHVRYGTRAASGGPWNTTDVDLGFADGYNSLALDSFGIPHIAYTTYSDTLRYAHLADTVWVREDIDASTPGAEHESLALDRYGNPHIAYYGNGRLRYASRPSANWVVEIADPRDYVGQFLQLGLDSSGQPHIAYYNGPGASLWYARKSPGGWTLSAIDAVGNPGRGISVVVGRDDRPRIAYYAQYLGELRYAEFVNGTWEIQIADEDYTVGWEPSIALDAAGIPHVTYYDWTRGALRHAVGMHALGARTVGASEVSQTDALLHGEVASLGGFVEANVSFSWRQVSEPVWRNTSLVSSASEGPFDARILGLTPGHRYEFRAVVEAGGETQIGRVLAFTTPTPKPLDFVPIILSAAAITVAAVGLSLAALTWFRGPPLFRRRGGRRRGGPA